MRFSARSKLGVLLSLVTILTLVSALAVTIMSHGSTTHASTGSTFQGISSQVVKAGSFKALGSKARPGKSVSPSSSKSLPTHNLGIRTLGHNGYSAQTSSAIHPSTTSSLTGPGNLQQNFNGLTNLDNAALNPFTVEPPDQGLCVGYLTDQSNGQQIPVEYEMVNDVIAIYLSNGNLVIKMSLGTFFGDVNFSAGKTTLSGDPRCYFDSLTHTFFFTVFVIGTSPYLPGSQSRIDLAVINADTQDGAEYLVDTTDPSNPSCPCYADAPNFGLDNNAVYVTGNEFPIHGTSFQGSELYVVSKPQLVNQRLHVHAVLFPHLFLNGFPVIGLQPAMNVSSTDSEYLENSFPYDASGKPIPVANVLALWHVTNDQAVSNGGIPKVTYSIIKVHNYAFPVDAASTGSGVTDANGFTPAAFLSADDDRMQQVEGIQDEGQIELWSALDTAVSFKNGTRDGIVWFRINPASANVVDEQGVVSSSNNFLLYPAILHSNNGTTAIVFSITGPKPKLNPSAAYVLSQSSPTNFGSTIYITAKGVNPYLEVTTSAARWGDYSAAALDPNGNDIWLATEYVPVQTSTNYFWNWGTDIFEVSNGD